MSGKRNKLNRAPDRFFGPQATSRVSWKLATRDERAPHHGGLFSASGKSGRFSHYIAAGGMRQHRRTWADDEAEVGFRRSIVLVCAAVLLWVVFYLLPCV